MVCIQSTLRCHYRYDPLDRLINQNQPDTPVHQRFYCSTRLATEIQGAIQHSIIQHGDLLLAQGRRQGDLIETTLLATDLQRSVLQTLNANQQGQPIAYSPYGHRRAESGLTSLLGFNGERPDPVTGHYLLGNGYRAFNPVLMRFHSPDNLSPFGKGGLNSYAYCLGNPVGRIDPTGHISWPSWLPSPKSIHVSSRNPFNAYWTKRWQSRRTAEKTAAKADDLISKAEKVTQDARNAVLNRDTQLAFSFKAPYKPTGHLEKSAYKILRPGDYKNLQPENNIFNFLENIETYYGGSQYEIAQLLAQAELSEYRPLLTQLNDAHPDMHMLSRFPSWTRSNNDPLERSYFNRMESIVPLEASKLTEKANRIRKKVFK